MPLNDKGRKVMRAMRKTYGSPKKAESVFYASINKGTIKGVEGKPKPPKRKFKFTRPDRRK